jgi:hypothetical protein
MDFENKTADDATDVLDQIGKTYQVYEQGTPADDAGFGAELPDHTFVKNVLALVQPATNTNTLGTRSNAGRATTMFFDGMTEDKDVRIGQLWVRKALKYRIISVDVSYPNTTNVRLELVK